MPEDIGRALAAQWQNLAQRVTEAVAIEGYRTGALNSAQVQRMLGMASRWEVDAFLKQSQAYLDYSE